MSLVRQCLPGLSLVAMVAAVYLRSVDGGPIFDDDSLIFQNLLTQSPDGLAKYWFSTEPSDYFPLTSTMFWLEWRAWGADTTGYHVVNMLLHALSCVLLWRVLRSLAIPGAWIGAMIFALHPVNVATVAWISQGKNTLPMVFALLSAWLYLRFDETPGRSRWLYAGAAAAFLAALLSKTSVVVLPPALLLCAWWRRGRISRADIIRTAPFFALSLVLGLVTVWYQTHVNIGDTIVRTDGLGSRLLLAGRAVWFYLGKAVMPVDLMFIYPRWQTGTDSWLDFVPLALLIATFGALIALRRRRGARAALFALGFYVLGLMPVLGFVNIYHMLYSLVADHWQYVSMIGFAGGVGALIWRLPAPGRTTLAAVIGITLAARTWQAQGPYRDAQTMWQHTLARNPTAWVAHYNLAHLYAGREQNERAVGHYEQALALNPDDAASQMTLGRAYLKLRRYDDAAERFAKVIALDPHNAEAHNNLGYYRLTQGRLDDAITMFRKALSIDPQYPRAARNLTHALKLKEQASPTR